MTKKNIPAPIWRTKPPYGCQPATQKLMQTTGLLTLALSSQCGSPLQVTLLQESFGAILNDEADCLQLSQQSQGWIRSVLLNCRGKPVLYARSFIPLTDIEVQQFTPSQHSLAGIREIGNEPLGIWLSQQSQLSRSTFEYSLSDAQYWPLLQHHSKWQLPARRSVFTHAQQGQLLLSEVFLS